MKTFTSIPALAIAALMISGSASATSINDIDAVGVNTASVMLTVDGEVATLTGDVNSFFEKAKLEQSALDLDGVEEVRNFLTY